MGIYMEKYIMALDAGTTSNRCILFDHKGGIVSVAQKEFTQIFPEPGWVEHDAKEIWSTQLGVAVEAMSKAGVQADGIAAIGITNQRETTIVWDKETGEPVYNAIVWQCRRTSGYCDALKEKGLSGMIRQKTGLVIDAYFSATKIKWILDNVPGARRRAQNGGLLFGTVDTWLIWKLTKGRVHVTDYSNASRTMMYNINDLKWDEDILNELDIPSSMLPEVHASSEIMNTGNKPVFSENGLVTTIAWGLDGKINYALEGSIFIAGAVIQWLRDEMHLIDCAADSEAMAQKVPDTNGCYVVPAFTGLGAPYWNQYARGMVTGLVRGTNRYHITRAALEAIAYQADDVLQAMKADSGIGIPALKADGGASANNFLMQAQADIINLPVICPKCIESTAAGAAGLAGLATGYWKNLEEIAGNLETGRAFYPVITEEERKKKLEGGKRAVDCARSWAGWQDSK